MRLIVSKEERLARAEKFAEAARSEQLDVLKAAYQQAAREGNEEAAAEAARAVRDRLLTLSDKEMSLDRLGLETSSATKLIASLASIFNGAWAKYRQALRDLPEQKGFPFDVTFPTPPDGESTGEK